MTPDGAVAVEVGGPTGRSVTVVRTSDTSELGSTMAGLQTRIARLERARRGEEANIRYCTCFVQVEDPGDAAQTGDLWQPL